MKLKIITLLLGVAGVLASVEGQENFTFLNYLGDTTDVNLEEAVVDNHYLGENIAIKFYRLRETYTYEIEGSVTNPVTQTVVDKPTIYHSLKKLNTYYKKQLKKGQIDSITARKELGWYFDVGFAIYRQDTSEFEKALKAAKKPDAIAQVFTQIVLE